MLLNECLRQVFRVLWTANRTNEWVLDTAGVARSLLASIKERKLAYHGHMLRMKGVCLEKEIRFNNKLKIGLLEVYPRLRG